MKNIILAIGLLLTTYIGFAQQNSITWGEEFKMSRGSSDLQVIYTDNSGVYLKEGHFALRSYFVVESLLRQSATLVKLDKNLHEIYRNDFNKELKGKNYVDLLFIKNRMYLLANSHQKAGGMSLYAVELNKADGTAKGDWKELIAWSKDVPADRIMVKTTYNTDSTGFMIVSAITGKTKIKYDISEFDENLRAISNPFSLASEFDEKTFSLENLLFTRSGNIVLVGKNYTYVEGKKKKAKYLEFTDYVITLYNKDGAKIKELKTTLENKWLHTSTVKQMVNNDIVIAAFYSNARRGLINGYLVQRINPATGEVITNSVKEITTAMLSAVPDEDEDDSSRKSQKAKDKLEDIKDENEGLDASYVFRNFIPAADGVIILAEKYFRYSVTTYSGKSSSTTYYDLSGEVLMAKVNNNGNIDWMHILPKRQIEEVGDPASFVDFNGYFSMASGSPYYGGIGVVALPEKNQTILLFNDNPKNASVKNIGEKYKITKRFGNTDCFIITLDNSTGNFSRKSFFSNKDIPIPMARYAVQHGNTMYIVGKDSKLIGKSKIIVGKAVFK